MENLKNDFGVGKKHLKEKGLKVNIGKTKVLAARKENCLRARLIHVVCWKRMVANSVF